MQRPKVFFPKHTKQKDPILKQVQLSFEGGGIFFDAVEVAKSTFHFIFIKIAVSSELSRHSCKDSHTFHFFLAKVRSERFLKKLFINLIENRSGSIITVKLRKNLFETHKILLLLDLLISGKSMNRGRRISQVAYSTALEGK